jgi:2-polyprenyl-3-methyl-5-hydroxy-6-metoxy-1,4-benzoquinol methylase
MNCRNCGKELSRKFLDLGKAPPCNDYVAKEKSGHPEVFYPLQVVVCEHCWLVQTTQDTSSEQLFRSDYAYFSSTSKSWLEHASNYTAHIRTLLALDSKSFVVEVASNDGYLLRNFVNSGIPCLGIEPTASTAAVARTHGVETVEKFFGQESAKQLAMKYGKADLLIGNNVFAHVPDIVDFSRGMSEILKPNGVVTLEFPHLLNLISLNQWDTVYHEHFSYLSLHAVTNILDQTSLRVFDVEKLSTHGGSLRLYLCLADSVWQETDKVQATLIDEREAGVTSKTLYEDFQGRVDFLKDRLVEFLIDCKKSGKRVVGYGAAGKGNTFLNYAGIKPDLLPVIFDAAVSKQGTLTPGSNIPIEAPEMLPSYSPDFVWILPWNIEREVKQVVLALADKAVGFVLTSPEFKVEQ